MGRFEVPATGAESEKGFTPSKTTPCCTLEEEFALELDKSISMLSKNKSHSDYPQVSGIKPNESMISEKGGRAYQVGSFGPKYVPIGLFRRRIGCRDPWHPGPK